MKRTSWEDCDCDNGWVPGKKGKRGGRFVCPKCGGQGSVLAGGKKRKKEEDEAYEQQ